LPVLGRGPKVPALCLALSLQKAAGLALAQQAQQVEQVVLAAAAVVAALAAQQHQEKETTEGPAQQPVFSVAVVVAALAAQAQTAAAPLVATVAQVVHRPSPVQG
jgi:hypothetical protein